MTLQDKQLIKNSLQQVVSAAAAHQSSTGQPYMREFLLNLDKARTKHLDLIEELIASYTHPTKLIAQNLPIPNVLEQTLYCPKCNEKLHWRCNNDIGEAWCTLYEPIPFEISSDALVCDFQGKVRRLGPNQVELINS